MHKKPSLQKTAARIAYTLFILGAILAAIGQYAVHNQLMVMLGIAIIAISSIPAIIAHPDIISF